MGSKKDQLLNFNENSIPRLSPLFGNENQADFSTKFLDILRIPQVEWRDKNLGWKILDFIPFFTKNFSVCIQKIISGEWKKGDGIGFVKSFDEANISPNDIGVIRSYLVLIGSIIYLFGNIPELGVATIGSSLALDATDGLVARKCKKGTKSGEAFDPFIDKFSEIITSFIGILQIQNNTTQLAGIIANSLKEINHFQKQFTPERGSLEEQMGIFKKFFAGEQDTNFVKEKSLGAAKGSGKIKTGVQFTSNFILLLGHTPSGEEFLKLLHSSQSESDIFAIILSFISLYFGYKK
ncbi:CDP-alcohol phosphatidyltransferase family protein [Candidatus Gracilibacteria bacterium]|nr:CDP-alcohol phosphatidyltransferase family protein [Candidatus Gracilibacteria bacterium]NUJ98561.1 CDP-alcohol phosphatidyltransferase family protein [Candidatus Gracilibacteria bacterium]